MSTTLDHHMESPEFRRLLAEEGFVNEVMERICDWMEAEGVSRAELARRLDTSKANVTQMLRGRNIGLKTLAAVVHVLEGAPEFRILSSVVVEAKPTQMAHLVVYEGGAGQPWRRAAGTSPYTWREETPMQRCYGGIG